MKINKNYIMKGSNKRAKISIYGDVGMISGDIKKDLDSFGDVNEIHYQINSYGGYVSEGFTIADDIINTGAKLISEGMGIVASIAAYLLIIPDKNKGGEVWAHENTIIMFHNPSGGAWGEAKLLRAEADALEKIEDILINTIMKRIKGLTKEEVRQKVADTWYLTAKEAKALGLVDKVLEKIEVEEPKTDLKMIIPENFKRIAFTNNIHAEPKSANKGVDMPKCKCGKEIAEGQEMCFECAVKKEKEEAKAAEKNRIQNINVICRASNLSDEFINKLIDSGKTVEQCSVEIAEEIKKTSVNNELHSDKGAVAVPHPTKVNKDESDKFRAHASNCLAVACGLEKDNQKISDSRKDVPINGLHALIRRSLSMKGIDSLWMDPTDLYHAAITNMSTGDIPAIIADVANKALADGYNSATATIQRWAGSRIVKDFKEMNIVKMSDFSDIDDMPEGSSFKLGKFSDRYEKASVKTKGKALSITREMIINDDLDSISRLPRAMAMSMGFKLNRDGYNVLTDNNLAGPKMNEVDNLFHENNGNKVTDSSGLGKPSITTISATEKLLIEQKAPKSEKDGPDTFLNIPAKFLIAGHANKTEIEQLIYTPVDPAKENSRVYNPYTGLIPIFDPYLQSKLNQNSKADGWYLAADPNVLETVGIAYLNGYTTPTLRSDEARATEPLGIIYTIFFDYGIYVADYRGIVFNPAA